MKCAYCREPVTGRTAYIEDRPARVIALDGTVRRHASHLLVCPPCNERLPLGAA